jgi:ABC-type transport system involved in cytochrome bd biosynthesis fused ATPase/permease subunit
LKLPHTYMIAGLFALCGAFIAYSMWDHDAASTAAQLLILAGLVVSFIDSHLKHRVTADKIDENTQLTAKTEQQINGRLDELIRNASQAAYAKGLLDGQQLKDVQIGPPSKPKQDGNKPRTCESHP